MKWWHGLALTWVVMVAWLTRAAALASISCCVRRSARFWSLIVRSRMPKQRRGHPQTDVLVRLLPTNGYQKHQSFLASEQPESQVTTAIRVTRTPCPSPGQEMIFTPKSTKIRFHQDHARAMGISERGVMGTSRIYFGATAMHVLDVVGLLSCVVGGRQRGSPRLPRRGCTW